MDLHLSHRLNWTDLGSAHRDCATPQRSWLHTHRNEEVGSSWCDSYHYTVCVCVLVCGYVYVCVCLGLGHCDLLFWVDRYHMLLINLNMQQCDSSYFLFISHLKCSYTHTKHNENHPAHTHTLWKQPFADTKLDIPAPMISICIQYQLL